MTSFRKELLGRIGALLGLVGAFFIVLLLISSDARSRAERAMELSVAIDAKIATLNSLATLKDNARIAEEDLRILAPLLPHKEALINFPKDLVRLGKTHGVEASISFSGENMKSESGLGGLQFSLSVVGAYEQLLLFYKDLELLPLMIRIPTVDIVRDREFKDRFTLTAPGQIFTR